MKKSDLKTGMLAESRNGRYYLILVIDGETVFANTTRKTSSDAYREDLTNKHDSSFDIMRVYGPHGKTIDELISTPTIYRNLIWQREEPKEMTIEEIQDKLGYKIKVVETKR